MLSYFLAKMRLVFFSFSRSEGLKVGMGKKSLQDTTREAREICFFGSGGAARGWAKIFLSNFTFVLCVPGQGACLLLMCASRNDRQDGIENARTVSKTRLPEGLIVCFLGTCPAARFFFLFFGSAVRIGGVELRFRSAGCKRVMFFFEF